MPSRKFPTRPWTWIFRGAVAVMLGGVIFVAYLAWFALKVEENLLAMYEATSLVEEFIEKSNGDWPHSWDELSPETRRLQQYVTIDFDSDPEVLANQTPEQFQAIRQKDQVHYNQGGVRRRNERVILALQKHRPTRTP